MCRYFLAVLAIQDKTDPYLTGIGRYSKFPGVKLAVFIINSTQPLEGHIRMGTILGIIIGKNRNACALRQGRPKGQAVSAGGVYLQQDRIFHAENILRFQLGSPLLPGKIAGIAIYRRTDPAGQILVKAAAGDQIFFLGILTEAQCLQRHEREDHHSSQQHCHWFMQEFPPLIFHIFFLLVQMEAFNS